MAFVKTIKALLLGLGNAVTSVQRVAVATNVGATTITLPASGSFAPTMSVGKLRVKTNSVGGASTSIVTKITGTDGVTTVDLYGGDVAASTAGTGIDHTYEFTTDLNLTAISVVVTTGVANCTHDVEVAGNS
jgi:hypothetical protein